MTSLMKTDPGRSSDTTTEHEAISSAKALSDDANNRPSKNKKPCSQKYSRRHIHHMRQATDRESLLTIRLSAKKRKDGNTSRSIFLGLGPIICQA